jgi:HK97 family phage major capsid protein
VNLKEMRAAALKAAQELIERAKVASRDLTAEEQATVEAKFAEIEELDKKIDAAAKSAALVARLDSVKEPEPQNAPDEKAPLGGLGDRFVKSAAFQEFRQSHPSGVGSGTPIRVEAKGLGGLAELGIGTKATITTATGQNGPVREPGYRNYLPVDAPLTFLDLITTGSTDVPYSEYAQVTAETNNAAIVAEGNLKPLSDVTTDKEESKAYTYADGFDITNQTLADDGALAAFLEARIRRHVLGVVEQKLFNGAGAGTEPLGIMNTTGTLAQAFDTDVVVTLARSLEKFQTNNGDTDAQAIVMHPTDVWNLRLLKGSDGHYLLGNPLQQGPIPTPWGVPLVPSSKLTAGTALVGRFDSVHFLELEALNVLAFNQHKDYAQRNMVYVRAELRGRQLFYAPREVVVADLTA